MSGMDPDTGKMNKKDWISATDNKRKPKPMGSDNNLKTSTPKRNPKPHVKT